jgi:hypothetical protein
MNSLRIIDLLDVIIQHGKYSIAGQKQRQSIKGVFAGGFFRAGFGAGLFLQPLLIGLEF